MADKFAIITGASTGIGFELATLAAKDGYDILVVANEALIQSAAADFKQFGTDVTAVEADLLVTTGGASVGDHDLVQPALKAAGGSVDFWRIALRPGKPMMAGRLGETVVLSLPGNPVSAFVTATLFVRPLIAHLAGAAEPLPTPIPAILGEDLPANGPRIDYLRAAMLDGRVHAAAIQDSSMLLTLARSTCLIVRPGSAPVAKAGESAEILVIA